MYIRDNRSLTESAVSDNYDPVMDEGLDESMYSNEYDNTDYGGIIDKDGLLEHIFIDAIYHMDDDQREAYLKSDEFSALCEAGIINVRESGVIALDKESRRKKLVKMAVLKRAQELGDADWEALRKNRIKERMLLERLMKKYAASVRADAMKAEKRFNKLHTRADLIKKEFNDISHLR